MSTTIEQRISEYQTELKKPVGFKFWDEKKESYLTLSVKIDERCDNSTARIKELQERIMDKVKNIDVLYNPYNTHIQKGLFRYPEDRFHFSLINFLIYNGDFRFFKNKIKEKKAEYSEIKEQIIKKINELIDSNGFKDNNARLGFLYDGEGKNKLDSFSLQAFLQENFIKSLMKIADDLEREKLPEKIKAIPDCKANIIVKGIPKCPNDEGEEPKRFPVNILRFLNFSEQDGLEGILNSDRDALIGEVESINNGYKKNGKSIIHFAIKKIILVESDPFLCQWNKIKGFDLND